MSLNKQHSLKYSMTVHVSILCLSVLSLDLGAVGGIEREPSLDLPLAKIIPVINGQVNHILSDSENNYFQDLFKVGSAREFAANVYEAFSFEVD